MTNQLIKSECKLQREDDKSYLSMPYRGDEDHAYALPSDPNCRSAQVPQGVENANGQGYIELPVFDSITKFMMSPKGANKRIVLYTYLNDQLHSGNLSRIVGVRIRLPIYDHKGLNSILFFEEGTIQVGVDKMKRDDDGRTFVFKDDHGEPMEIPANTIIDASVQPTADFLRWFCVEDTMSRGRW